MSYICENIRLCCSYDILAYHYRTKRVKTLKKCACICVPMVLLLIIGVVILILSKKPQEDLDTQFAQLRELNASWLSDDKLLYLTQEGDYIILDFADLDSAGKAIDLTHNLKEESDFEFHSLSQNQKFVLFESKIKKRDKFSTVAQYMVKDLEANKSQVLSFGKDSSNWIWYALWGLDNKLILMKDCSLYMMDCHISLTKKHDVKLYNDSEPWCHGGAEWLYYDKILKTKSTVWFSEGNRIAFISFNVHGVPMYNFLEYSADSYPHALFYDKPQVNGQFPKVDLYEVNLEGVTDNVLLYKPKILNKYSFNDETSRHYYVKGVHWHGTFLYVIWTAKNQTRSAIWRCTVDSECQEVYLTEENEVITGNLLKSETSHNKFYLPLLKSDKIMLIRLAMDDEGHVFAHAISHNVTVTEILALKQDKIYFLAIPEYAPAAKHLYVIEDGSEPAAQKCLSCDATNSRGEDCNFNDAHFNDNANFYIWECTGPGVPQSFVYNENDHIEVKMWEDNEDVYQYMETLQVVKTLHSIRVDEDFSILVKTFKKTEEEKEMPLVMKQTGDPGENPVTAIWEGMSLSSRLAASLGVLVAEMDTAPSTQRLIGHLGERDLEDLLIITEKLSSRKGVVGDKVAVWGDHYGAFLAVKALAHEESPFSCGVIVDPVYDILLQDPITYEQYNVTHTETSLKSINIQNLNGKQLLLVYHTAGSQVSDAMQIISLLQESGISFNIMVYPNEITEEHYFSTVQNFFAKCLDL